MRVVWTCEASLDLEEVINYILYKWSASTADNFLTVMEEKIKLIQFQPDIFELVNHKNIRRATITPQLSLYYQVEPNEIVFLRLWNNYRNPEKLKL